MSLSRLRWIEVKKDRMRRSVVLLCSLLGLTLWVRDVASEEPWVLPLRELKLQRLHIVSQTVSIVAQPLIQDPLHNRAPLFVTSTDEEVCLFRGGPSDQSPEGEKLCEGFMDERLCESSSNRN